MSVPDQPITPQLSEYLAGRPELAKASVEALSGDASTRRYFRLRIDGGTRIATLYPEPFDESCFDFVVTRRLLAGYGLPVPEILDLDGRLGVVVLEDLGATMLQDALETASDAERTAFYREAIEQLVVLQRESAVGPRTAACFDLAFDTEKLSWELHFFEEHFLAGHRGCQLSEVERAVLAEEFRRLAEEVASWPRVLCHRDYHSRNLMLCGGRLHWIDFQDARMGPVTYDLASLLRDSYVELPEELVEEMAELFRSRAVTSEAPQAFQRRLALTCVQRNLKALGTFGYQATVRGTQTYLPYVPRTLASARRYLASRPELAPLRKALARHLEELA